MCRRSLSRAATTRRRPRCRRRCATASAARSGRCSSSRLTPRTSRSAKSTCASSSTGSRVTIEGGVAAPPPLPRPPLVMRLGAGLGRLRIGARRVVFGERFRTERHRENDSGGCSGSPILDSFVDYYDGRRLGYVFTFGGKTFLDTIATTRVGDRSAVGFAIGRATLGQVRRRYRHAAVLHEHARYFLGATQL